MKRIIYFSLLITGVVGLGLLGVGVPQGHTGGGGDLTVPETWRGTWEVTVAYRDHATGRLVATDVTTAAICPGEPIMPALLSTTLHCSGEAAASEIGVLCSAKRSPRPGCNVFVNADLDSQREGNTWSGAGSWTAKVVGNCEHVNFGEDFVVSGTRVSNEAACDGEQSSLVRRFFAHSELVPVLAGSDMP
ncbi:MAG: hypothetical protein ABJA18_02375 [bacterium]